MTDHYYGSEGCPNCDHALDHHDGDNGGCQVGWRWDEDGVAEKHGCLCNLAVVR